MPTITWFLTINDAPHTVRLMHSKYGGLRQVFLDEQLIAEERELQLLRLRRPRS